jgi:hypothetical protein
MTFREKAVGSSLRIEMAKKNFFMYLVYFTLESETLSCLQMLGAEQQMTKIHIPVERKPQLYRCVNLKTRTINFGLV